MPLNPIWLILALPLLGVLINGFFGHRLPRGLVGGIGCTVVLAAFGIAASVMFPEARELAQSGKAWQDYVLYEWIRENPALTEGIALNVPFGVRVDTLSATMVLVVTGVGFLIHFYSTAYMADDPVVLFLGGWQPLFPIPALAPAAGTPLAALGSILWFVGKILVILVIYMWLRATLPRLRYDRLMAFTWKGLLPVALLNILVIATLLTVFYPAAAPDDPSQEVTPPPVTEAPAR